MSRPPSDRALVHRHPERGIYDRDVVDAILDEALICHVAWVTPAGEPRVIPTIHVRVGDTLYIHGSQASRTLRAARTDIPLCIDATIVDGIVLARSTPKHSLNYRSAVVYGAAREVTDPAEMDLAQRALVEHVVPGRTADARMPSDKELKETAILAISLDEASAKIRTGGPIDDAADVDLPIWAGVLPLRLGVDEPEPAADLPDGTDIPGYLSGYGRTRPTA